MKLYVYVYTLSQVSLYEDDTSQDKSHGIQQVVDDDCFDSIPFCLQVCSAANHAPWIIQRTIARCVLVDILYSSH